MKRAIKNFLKTNNLSDEILVILEESKEVDIIEQGHHYLSSGLLSLLINLMMNDVKL